jgi:quercetin dioxygenase-like cupin family protein
MEDHFEFDPKVEHFFGGGAYIKSMCIPAGNTIIQHKHTYDHLSLLATGSVLVMVDGVVSRYTAPACILIASGKHHAVEALTDTVWYCIHATDCTDINEVDNQLIEKV